MIRPPTATAGITSATLHEPIVLNNTRDIRLADNSIITP